MTSTDIVIGSFGVVALALVLDRANDRGQDRPARTARNCLRDNAANAEVAALCRRDNRWQNQCQDLTEYAAADHTRNNISDGAEIELR